MARCKHCGAEFCASRPNQVCCSRTCKETTQRNCDCCGSQYQVEAKRVTRYCSRVCSNKARKGKPYPIGVAYQRAKSHPHRIAAWFNAHLKAGFRLRPCDQCGVPHDRNAGATYCSHACGIKAASFRRWVKHTKGKASECPACGVLFCGLYQHKGQACSQECSKELILAQKRRSKSKRRAVTRAPTAIYAIGVDPFSVFNRDKWVCRGCGDWTPRELRGTTHDNAPELDHIVPISKGGSHSADNLQLLCRVCNILKADMDMDDFKKEYIKQ